MEHLPCTVRDYDPSTKTCTIELTGAGAFDLFLSGIAVAAEVQTQYLTYGATGTLVMPDIHRLCEATLIAVNQKATASITPSGTQTTQTGRAAFSLSNSGTGTVSVTYPVAYANAPSVSISVDKEPNSVPSISNLTRTGFTASFTDASYANQALYFTWTSTGN